jgi:endonuclease VIII
VPEGDTLFRAARAVHDALAGRQVTAFSSTVPRVSVAARQHRVVGRTVEQAESHGKHLLVRFSGGLVLHTHLGMTGSWHLYGSASRWRLPRHLARAVIETGDRVAVCFQAPTVELLLPDKAATRLASLGPDVLSREFDEAEACARLRARNTTEIAVALLDQQALAGIGNVYKSEVLFLRRLDPRRPVASLSDDELRALVGAASALLKMNAQGGPRRTTPFAEPLWVYGRAGRACRRCGATIVRFAQGRPARSTYVCPRCQEDGELRPGGASPPSSSPRRTRP